MFDNWTIPTELFEWIRENLPDGKTILELGSGNGTTELLKHYTVYSIEHDPAWIGQTKSNYIFAPIISYEDYEWYDSGVLLDLPKYDLILVDGPTGKIGRGGFYRNSHLFDMSVPIVIDDTQRYAEFKLAGTLGKSLNREVTYFHETWRKFAVIK